jgi:RNA-directed DNA polymerase
VTLETSGSQNRETSKHGAGHDGEAESEASRGTAVVAVHERTSTEQSVRMEDVVASDNLQRACKKVQSNEGIPGVDGMTTDALPAWLARNEGTLREQLLSGRYKPQVVQRVEIPKPNGGVRMLGIPTVVDRLVQQALLQVMQPQIDPTFSAHSYGFRPGRSAHQAVAAAQEFVREGKQWVVDVDLEAFFDRVNHDVLMSRVARRIEDKRVLKTVRAFLEAGIMVNGVAMASEEGTPQGGPLSPLLANILLDEVDKELEARGHSFVRYADDCNVYVRTENAAQRVLNSLRKLYAGLRLKINESKSAAASVWGRSFLSFMFYKGPGEEGPVQGISTKARERFRDRVR